MYPILKKLWKLVFSIQVLAVLLAFGLMVFLSNYYMSNIEREHLLKDVKNSITTTQAYIEGDLIEMETTLTVLTENVRDIIIQYNSRERTDTYLKSITQYMMVTDDRLRDYVGGIYGIFQVFDDVWISGVGRIPPDDYIVKERPWYDVAIKANGKVGITQPYIDFYSGEVSITFTRCIIDDDGTLLAIVCLDVNLERIRRYAVNTYVSEGSYGILMDNNFNVLAHPHPLYVGRHITQMNDGRRIQSELLMSIEISERKTKDYNDKEAVLFVRQLNNGWYLAIVLYADKYYQSVREIAYILILLGLIFAIILIIILFNVIGERKKTEDRMMTMFDSTPLGSFMINSENKCLDCNQEIVRLFELNEKKEYLGRFLDFSPEYQTDGKLSKEKFAAYTKKAFEEGCCRFEWLHRKPNGELLPCEITFVRVVFRNENVLCGYTRDLRELRTMMAKMREADECVQVLFDSTPLSCFMIDNTFKVLECNQEIIKLFEISNKQDFVNNIYDFFPEYQSHGELSRDKIYRYFNQAFEEGYCSFEWIHQTQKGEQIPTEVSLVRVKFRGVYTVAGYIRDLREIKAMVAEMRRAEIAEESSKAKSDFLARMSHEIRTPMNAILGITEIQLQNTKLPQTIREALERVYNSGDLLLGIINDILDLSKIEAGKLEIFPTQYDVASLIYDVVKLNMIRYESKPIKFKLDVNENVPMSLVGDELRIKQILNNILSNAFKYTYEGQVELRLYTESTEDDSNVVLVFRVSDTGQGMTQEQVKRLGDKFSRFNTEANRSTEGTGLGMNITRNLIQLMNGEIGIESIPGMGSAFTVRLLQGYLNAKPIGKELADNLMKLNLKNTAKTRNLHIRKEFMPYGRVLVVDDVDTNLYVARGLLAPYGLSVDTAVSGFEALDRIRHGAVFDVIFMDHMMPKMDGIETTKKIRSLGYSNSVVALTANAITGQEEVFLNNGFDDFISKPIDVRQLNSVLNRLIRDKQKPETIQEARRQRSMLFEDDVPQAALDPQLAEFFVSDAEKAIMVLNNIYDNNCRRNNDISIFVLNIHAMKSALANIGETELSLEAEKLEHAGRTENVNFILSQLPHFLTALREVIEQLKPAEDEDINEAEDDIQDSDRAFLHEKLHIIHGACTFFDKKNAKEALAELKEKKWSKPIRDKLARIAEHLLHSEFEEAAVLAKDISSL